MYLFGLACKLERYYLIFIERLVTIHILIVIVFHTPGPRIKNMDTGLDSKRFISFLFSHVFIPLFNLFYLPFLNLLFCPLHPERCMTISTDLMEGK